MSVTPNYDEAIAFLRAFRPKGFWMLTAVRVDKKSIETIPFVPSQTTEVRGWLEKMGAEHEDPLHNFNLYFHVNPTIRMMSKKAEKEDVATMEYLHVDIDQRAGQEFEAERARALRLLTEAFPSGVPKPTFIIDSGGGYHGYWKLKEPFKIDGDQEAYSHAERFNLQLQYDFSADHCHNVDRIMRLPGTINRPDKKKIEKGRVTCLSSLVSHDPEAIYELSQFVAAPLIQTGVLFGASSDALVSIKTGNIQRLNDIDDLKKYGVPQHTLIVIVQGIDPDEPGRWPSRSEPLWYVCNELVRHAVPDEIIYSILTDDRFKISESVLEKGRGADKYAKKQINDAKERGISPKLHELNSKHAVVRDVGGHCKVISEGWDNELGRTTLSYQTAGDFTTFYQNQSMEITVTGKDGPKVISQPLGKWWLTHPQRRSYESVIFAPGREFPGSYNLWTGFAVDPKPGKCELYLAHVKENICSGNEEHYHYVLGWMALAVQRPGEQGHTALVLQGDQGTGKGKFATTFGSLFGRHFMAVTHGDHLVGKFNSHLRDCVVLFGDEAFYAGDKKHEGMLKVLITEQLLMTEKKGVDASPGRNYTHLILASNNEWVIPAGENERRYFMIRVSNNQRQNNTYFAAIDREMDNGGREALLHFLMHYDLRGFNVRDVPKTEALQSQKEWTFDPVEEWWYSKLQDGEIFDGEGWPAAIPRANIRESLVTYTKAYGASLRSSATRLGSFLKKVLPPDWDMGSGKLKGTHNVIGEDGEPVQVTNPNGYVLPPLEACRESWERLFGGSFKWQKAAGTTTTKSLGLQEEAF
jgi:Mesyanzhinovviridae DNA primase